MQFYRDAVPLQLALQQHERLLDERGEISGHAVGAAIASHAELAVGDLLGPLGGGQDFRQRFVARSFIFMPEAKLGIVDDRRQHVVEFVRGGAHELAER